MRTISGEPYRYEDYVEGNEISLLSPRLNLNSKNIAKDKYPNERDIAPVGWEPKLLSVSYRTPLPSNYQVNNAFGPTY